MNEEIEQKNQMAERAITFKMVSDGYLAGYWYRENDMWIMGKHIDLVLKSEFPKFLMARSDLYQINLPGVASDDFIRMAHMEQYWKMMESDQQ